MSHFQDVIVVFPSFSGTASLQPGLQPLPLCWPLCLQAWATLGSKIPPPASIQCTEVPEIPSGRWPVSSLRYHLYFMCLAESCLLRTVLGCWILTAISVLWLGFNSLISNDFMLFCDFVMLHFGNCLQKVLWRSGISVFKINMTTGSHQLLSPSPLQDFVGLELLKAPFT